VFCNLLFIGFACLSGFAMLALQIKTYLISLLLPYCLCLTLLGIFFLASKKAFQAESIDSLRAEFVGRQGAVVYVNECEIECGETFPIEKFQEKCRELNMSLR